MSVSPIGSFLVTFDAQILTSTDAALSGLGPYLSTVVGASCLIFLGARGVRITNGDGGALQAFWFDVVKMGLVIYLCLDLGNYDTWVRDFFYTSIPSALNTAFGGGGSVANGVPGTAATFDLLYNQVSDQMNKAWASAGYLDFGTRLAAFLCAQCMEILLLCMAGIYMIARVLLGVVLVLGPICIACSLHETTAPIFERWMGKVVALILLQVTGIIVLVMVFNIDKGFVAQISGAASPGTWAATDGSPSPTAISDLSNLTGMLMWFGMGAFALFCLPTIAYSIGTGVAVNMTPFASAVMSSIGMGVSAASALLGNVSLGGGSGAGGAMSLSLARDELEGASQSALSPPPPPSLASSATLQLGGP